MSGVFVGLQLSKGNLCKQWYGESFCGRELGIKYRISGESIVVLDKIIVKNTFEARGRGYYLQKASQGVFRTLDNIKPIQIVF